MATVQIAKCAGACYGVERALKLVEEAATGEQPTFTIGPLIHNPLVVANLEAKGVHVTENVEDVDAPATVVVRSHGVVPQVIEAAEARGLHVVDATCPHVKHVHKAAELLASEGYQVVVVGDPGHAEVEGIFARAGKEAVVMPNVDCLNTLTLKRKVGVVVQTTQSQALLESIIQALMPKTNELRVFNTICAATAQRQNAATELAAHSDAMIVIGGKNSGNTRRLAQVCSEVCGNTHHIETPSELDACWFAGAERIGVTAGASTPAQQIEELVTTLEDMVCRAI